VAGSGRLVGGENYRHGLGSKPSLGNCLKDISGNSPRILVLPEPENPPPSRRKQAVALAIAGDISVELLSPPFLVQGRAGRMQRATMPKASVNEYREAEPGKHNVGLPPPSRQWPPVHEVSKAGPKQLVSNGQLQAVVAALVGLH
jgi:hypothetical protein